MISLEELAKIAEARSIWRPLSVEQEPQTKLTQWRVMKVADTTNDVGYTIHFVGYAYYEGRVCSAVQKYDPTTKRGITRSGRIYELIGHSGFNRDALYVWDRWVNGLGNPTVEDITDQYETTN